jgi:hypothetical protein
MSNPPKAINNEISEIVESLPQTNYGAQEIWSTGKVRFEMLPEGYIALNKELATGLHSKLQKLLLNHYVDDIDIKLSEIAMYCGVVLDGTYTLAERDKLCFILAGRLEVLREIPTGIIVN